jgi:ribosomal-protein-alanine N-acetyltransferase
MKFPEELLTPRLLLRPPTEADCEEIFTRYAHDPQVTQYLSWRPHKSVADTIEFRRKSSVDVEAGRVFPWLIRSSETRNVLGMIGLRIDGHTVHLGYCLARDAWRQGFATEAASAVVAVAMNEPSIWRLQALCDLENRASARVLEKFGLTFEGTLRRYMVLPNLSDTPRDVHCYAKSRE